MSLIDYDMWGSRIDKVQMAIDRLKTFQPTEGYYLAYSGGKDSGAILALAELAGVKYEAHYNITTVDPPELFNFIRDKHPEVIRDSPPMTMWQLIVREGMPPTRICRYCCEVLKETQGVDRVVVTGVRWAESINRRDSHGVVSVHGGEAEAQIARDNNVDFRRNRHGGIVLNLDNDAARRMVEMCYRTHKTLVNPIVDWSDDDVWEFHRAYGIPYCGLYDEGYHRLGCIGCPLSGSDGMKKNFARWPKYRAMYVRAFDKMLAAREASGEDNCHALWKQGGEGVMTWWLSDRKKIKTVKGQMKLEV